MQCTIFNNGLWKTEVVACILEQNKLQIPINKSIENGNDEWKCKMNNGIARLIKNGIINFNSKKSPNKLNNNHDKNNTKCDDENGNKRSVGKIL